MVVHNWADIFDRSGKVRGPSYVATLRDALSYLVYHSAPPDPDEVASGDGHVVLLVPAMLTTDKVNQPLQSFLNACGYRAFGWGLGVNWGPTPSRVDGLRARLADLCAIEGGPVSVVGLSLGGLLARDLAHECPRDVRQVITIFSPFRLPTATVAEPFFHLLALCYSPAIDVPRLGSPLTVPAAAIYSREDGIVAWESCRSDDLSCENIEVDGTHFAAPRNPNVLRAVARRLGEMLRPARGPTLCASGSAAPRR